MKRLLRVRILIVLIALALVPLAILPFAERIRSEWVRFWEPELEEIEVVEFLDYGVPLQPSIYPTVTDIEFMDERTQTLTVPIEPAVELPDA